MKDIPLGRRIPSPEKYDPAVLYPIPRRILQSGVYGFDLWRAYELSWLNGKGKPEASILQIIYPVSSKNIVESKSLKLYLHGISETVFPGPDELVKTIRRDLKNVLVTDWVRVSLLTGSEGCPIWVRELPGDCIDGVDIGRFPDRPDPGTLRVREDHARESLHSHLLRTYCPITRQPDWASVLVEYQGKGIDRASLLKYLCSYRNHKGFSEECCETIYRDILSSCSPERLTVSCFYTRRGGIDINPVRSSFEKSPEETGRYRLLRQ